jgi:hypothetical protein
LPLTSVSSIFKPLRHTSLTGSVGSSN